MAAAACSIPGATLALLVFDLDGTLIDSRADLCASVNATLAHFGRPPLPDHIIASYIGDGAQMLVRRAIGAAADTRDFAAALDFFLSYYREHKLDQTYVYEGVFPALVALRAALPDARMAVLSNKPVAPSQAICEALGLSPFFFRICGGNSFETKKPNPQGLRALMRLAAAGPRETLMIGDSGVDILTARNAGAWSLGCNFGLAPHSLDVARPDWRVDAPEQWTQILSGESVDATASVGRSDQTAAPR